MYKPLFSCLKCASAICIELEKLPEELDIFKFPQNFVGRKGEPLLNVELQNLKKKTLALTHHYSFDEKHDVKIARHICMYSICSLHVWKNYMALDGIMIPFGLFLKANPWNYLENHPNGTKNFM